MADSSLWEQFYSNDTERGFEKYGQPKPHLPHKNGCPFLLEKGRLPETTDKPTRLRVKAGLKSVLQGEDGDSPSRTEERHPMTGRRSFCSRQPRL